MTTLRSLHRSWSLYGALLAVLLVFAGCGGANGEDDDGDDSYTVQRDISDENVAAVVSSDYGTDTLRTAEFQQQLQFARQSMPPNQQGGMARIHQMMLDQYVNNHVLRGEAEARDVQADTATVAQQLQQQRGQFSSEEEFQDALGNAGLTLDSLRTLIAEQVRVQQLRDEIGSDAVEEPTDTEVDEYAAEQRSVSARHILLQVGENADDSTATAAREQAEELITQLNDGADFAELAREYSDGPTADRGGDLGSFTRDRMVEPFADAVFALEEDGQIVQEPVRTQFGYHVIQLTDYGEPMDTEQARSALVEESQQEAYQNALSDLTQQVTVSINPDVVTLSAEESDTESESDEG
ncbi:peptidylprolyl isomerase [Longimonas halophila]|uniref:Peptidylprolyl isomerase n=1 Tax=Longimonas halophila TaxID=1469170 RepID=A0A2H3NMH9_9BACT|nr:peptidylprolyl isomerase [Longimonas halophila]PEN05983.1 peptidylprolyl isomerase [Longimonas halophila]